MDNGEHGTGIPMNVQQLSLGDLQRRIIELRDRRLRARRVYELAKAVKKQVKREKDTTALEKKLTQFDKLCTAVDLSLQKIEDKFSEIRLLTFAVSGEIIDVEDSND